MITIDILKKDIDNYIEDYFKNKEGYNKIIYDAMGYSMKIGGKRIRPMLLILSYNLYEEEYKDILPLAVAMEMIHTYSLIHDDLPCMDNDNLRRGKPTNHKVYGEAIATLAGDALLNEAMVEMFKYSLKRGENALRASRLIAESAGAEGMIGGQVVDILGENKKVDLDELLYMHKNKTGALIKASILAGAIMGNATEKELEILNEYGEDLGLAFQIKDDILDVTGDTKILGKNINKDEESNKSNFITFFGLEECENKCKELTEKCIKNLKKLNRNAENLEYLTKVLLDRTF